MVRRFIVPVALASAMALSAAGCGTEKKDPPEVAWAGRACAVLAQGAPLQVPKLDSADVLKSRASLVKLLDGISTRMRTLETGLSGLGAPPVDNGEAVMAGGVQPLQRLPGARAGPPQGSEAERGVRESARLCEVNRRASTFFDEVRKSCHSVIENE